MTRRYNSDETASPNFDPLRVLKPVTTGSPILNIDCFTEDRPVEGIETTHTGVGSPQPRSFTEDRPDEGIETLTVTGRRALTACFTEDRPDEGIETLVSRWSYSNGTASFTEDRPVEGIETLS